MNQHFFEFDENTRIPLYSRSEAIGFIEWIKNRWGIISWGDVYLKDGEKFLITYDNWSIKPRSSDQTLWNYVNSGYETALNFLKSYSTSSPIIPYAHIPVIPQNNLLDLEPYFDIVYHYEWALE